MKKFNEDLNTAVITTKYVLNENSPILVVYHFDDGFWQFSGEEENLQDEDYKLISLEEIICVDRTLHEIADLPFEWKAYWKNIDSNWQRETI